MKDVRLASKMEGKTDIFEALETVWWLDLTDSDPAYFTTDLGQWMRSTPRGYSDLFVYRLSD